ncbi:hypothetical protein KEM60_02567 [Austwickia sp. TVS 96-490-7B]|nr:hypothetical protein [Austwickia sp. TVS 96-490-7B]
MARRAVLPHVQERLHTRLMFHHDRDVIEVRLTMVMTILGNARELKQRTGMSIK